MSDIVRVNGEYYETQNQIDYPYGPSVPAGFVFDGMSSPKWVAIVGIGNQDHRMLWASAQHDAIYGDYLGRYTDFSRDKADLWLYKNLRKAGVPYIQAAMIYAAVREFGGDHWRTK